MVVFGRTHVIVRRNAIVQLVAMQGDRRQRGNGHLPGDRRQYEPRAAEPSDGHWSRSQCIGDARPGQPEAPEQGQVSQ
jgi:hypothetical protein